MEEIPDLKGQHIPWWKKTVVYQIYPRSFADSNGDGIGDIQGILGKLDYLKDLGIETIWISPFFSSPQKDFGYDISDYRDIAPEYGVMRDVELLIAEVHDRGMKIVLDLVLNHTSDEHPWFLESRKNRTNPKRDWYIWRDGKKARGKAPPTNWKSRIGMRGWHYDLTTDQWYWAQFLPYQPDLNYRNAEVKQIMLDNVRFWLKKDIDGFRLDIIDAVYEDDLFRNAPFMLTLFGSDKHEGIFFQSSKYTVHHPDSLEFMKELRKIVDEYTNPSRFLVGEVSGPLPTVKKYCGSAGNEGLHTVFLFQTYSMKMTAKSVRTCLLHFEQHFPDPYVPTWAFSNHDIARTITRLGNRVDLAKLLVAFQLTARGIPFIYYGEEIGIEQHTLPMKHSLDPVNYRLRKWPRLLQKVINELTRGAINRDNCRTPMQWDDSENAGFTASGIHPWLPLSPSFQTRNVAVQQKDDHSLWNVYQRFLHFRTESSSLRSGYFSLIPDLADHPHIVGFTRKMDVNSGEEALVFLNFSNITHNVPLILEPSDQTRFVTTKFLSEQEQTFRLSRMMKTRQMILDPWEAVVIRLVRIQE